MKKKSNKLITVFLIILIIFIVVALVRVFYYSTFSIEDYDQQVKRCSERDMGYTQRIDNKLDALNAIDEVFSFSTDDANYFYTVSYDKQNDCWLVIGDSAIIYNFIYCGRVTGGRRGAIIKSDGTVIAGWVEY